MCAEIEYIRTAVAETSSKRSLGVGQLNILLAAGQKLVNGESREAHPKIRGGLYVHRL